VLELKPLVVHIQMQLTILQLLVRKKVSNMCMTCGCGKKKGEAGYGKGKSMSPKQKKIASAAAPKDKITGADFKALKKKGK